VVLDGCTGSGVVGWGFPAELVWRVLLNVKADSASARVFGVSPLPFSPSGWLVWDDIVDGRGDGVNGRRSVFMCCYVR